MNTSVQVTPESLVVDADILRSCTDTHICHDHAFLRVDKSHIATGKSSC